MLDLVLRTDKKEAKSRFSTTHEVKPNLWQLATRKEPTHKNSTFYFETNNKSIEDIWEHCSCTVYKKLLQKKKYDHTEADSGRVFSTSQQVNNKPIAGNNS